MHCRCYGVCQIRLEIWPEPDLAGFGKNSRISDLPEPKSGATLSNPDIFLTGDLSVADLWKLVRAVSI